MPENPYSDEELKRKAQVSMLNGQPTANTMPIGGAPTVIPEGPKLGGNRSKAPMPGWSAENWSDPNMHSVKYDAGDFFYGKTKPSEIGQIVQSADFQKRFPGATFNGKDWVDFHGVLSDGDHGVPVNGIDVLMGADPEHDTSNGVWWGAPDEASAVAGTNAASPRNPALDVAGDNSAIARIMKELSAAHQGEPSPAEREALMKLLQQNDGAI